MGPTRRIKAASVRTTAVPVETTPDEEEQEEQMEQDGLYTPQQHRPGPYQRQSSASFSSGAYPLQRGTACLSCRKRKMVSGPNKAFYC